MSRLETKVLGMTFPNPFILATGLPTVNSEMVIEAFKAGWGSAVLKTIALKPTKNPSPSVHIIKTGETKWGMLDIELISEVNIDRWEDEIDCIRDDFAKTTESFSTNFYQWPSGSTETSTALTAARKR